jgi:putative membrane protein
MNSLANSGITGFLFYFGASLAFLVAFTMLYIRVTPYDESADISKGNLAPAVALAGAMLGFTFPLLVASYVHTDVRGFLTWAIIACITQLGVFWALHRLLPNVIVTNNVAGATCFAAASVCAGLMNAASFIP